MLEQDSQAEDVLDEGELEKVSGGGGKEHLNLKIALAASIKLFVTPVCFINMSGTITSVILS